VLVTDKGGGILYVNPECEKILHSKGLVGKNYRDVLSFFSKDPSFARSPFEECIAEKREVSQRISLNLYNGHEIVVEFHITPLLDSEGDLKGCIFLFRDITPLYEKEILLKESEEKFRAVAESSPMGILLYQDDRWIYVNPAAERICGYDSGEMVGREIWEVVPPDFKERVEINGALREQGIHRPPYELKIITRTGREKWLLLSGCSITINGKKAGLITALDITRQKEMEEELKRSRIFYKAVFDNSSTALAVVDEELNIIHANIRFGELFRINKLLLEHNRNLKDFLFSPKLEEMIEELKQSNSRGQRLLPVEITGVTTLSDPLYLLCSVSYLPETRTFVVSLQDITSLKEVQRINIDLERQLKQSQKMEAIGLLAGGIAHDFNNILQGIYSGLSLLQKNEYLDVKVIENIEELIQRGSKLVRGLLAFGRSDNFSKFTRIDVNRVVEDVIELFTTTIPKNILINTYLANEELLISGDPMQIQQVIMNLISNAVDAIGEEGGEITISTCRACMLTEEHKPYVVIGIHDTGEGIKPEDMERIYDPFFTTKPANKGSGLGLSIVYGIIRDHKGFIECRSKRGEGTVFEIFLPAISPISRIQEMEETEPEEEVKEGNVDTGPMAHILIIDDEEMILETTSEYLREFGYKITTADTGKKALSLFEERSSEFDVVLLDLNLPEISGHELLKLFLEIDPSVKIIVCSGYSPQELDIPEGATKNVSFLAKPYSMNSLLREIRHKLD